MPLPPTHPGLDPHHPVLLFDGYCSLCSRSVGFIIRNDTAARFRFVPLQSPTAERLLLESNAPSPLPDSMIVVDAGHCYTRSAAALRLARRLPFPWPLLFIFVIIPRPLRDALYRTIARNRYAWFGQRETCMMPTPDIRARFLD